MLYLLLIFVGAFLLFQVQPLIAKIILPSFGGGAAVWTSCLLFFQGFLLLGYLYAHKLTQLKSIKSQCIIHSVLLLLSLAVLPLGTAESSLLTANNEDPLLAIITQLSIAVGLPYFLLASTGPMVQRWLTFLNRQTLPYKLYSLSNFASLLALLTFPFLLEPLMTSIHQSWFWSILYGIYVCLFFAVMLKVYRQCENSQVITCHNEETNNRVSIKHRWSHRFLWGALAAVGVVLLVATTSAMTQNIPPVPFLWILPLCLYLLTFIICFHSPKWYVRGFWLAIFSLMAMLALFMFFIGTHFTIVAQVVIYSGILFSACMLCHGELVRLKPKADGLTLFYLMLALGGFLGSAFVAFVAQALFVQFLEFPLAILLVFLLFACSSLVMATDKSWLTVLSLIGFVLFFIIFILINQRYLAHDVYSARNFYGILSVKDVTVNGQIERRLIDGTTSHGTQSLQANKRSKPLSYYREGTGVALAITQIRQAKQKDTLLAAQLSAHSGNLDSPNNREQQHSLLNHGLNVGLIGLGAGTLAAYGEPGDTFTFYELNPAVIRVAKEYFSYLEDSQAEIKIIQGDARVSMAKLSMNDTFNDYDLLVLDAFSGDSIPQHLLTTQAIALYLKQLSPEGAIVVHVSNSHLDLLGLMAGLAKHANLAHQYFYTKAESESGHDSQWVLLTNNKMLIKSPTLNAHKNPWPNTKKTLVWTDDHSSLLSVLK